MRNVVIRAEALDNHAAARAARHRDADLGPSGRHDSVSMVRSAWAAVLGAPELFANALGAEALDAEAVDAEALDELQAASHGRAVPAGGELWSRHETARDLVLLAHGDAALGLASGSLAFHPERTVRAPHWLDVSSAWLSGRHAQDAIAVSDVQLVCVSRSQFQAAMTRHPALTRRLLVALALQVRALTAATHDLMHKDAEGRFAAWLLQRCAGQTGRSATVVALTERKRDIAAQLAITPETLSRLLRQLKNKGMIQVTGYTVRVLDLPALEALARD